MPCRAQHAAAAQQPTRTSPHEAAPNCPLALVLWPAARGFVVGAVAGIPRWHARGQGFESPQLHQAQRTSCSSAQGRSPGICQSLTSCVWQNTLCVDRFASFGPPTRSPATTRAVVRTLYTEAQAATCGRPQAAVLGRRTPDAGGPCRKPPSRTASPAVRDSISSHVLFVII
jgi:hypothetical protein